MIKFDIYKKNNNQPNFKAKIMLPSEGEHFKSALLAHDVFNLHPHLSPDDDANAVTEVLTRWLERAGKKVHIAMNFADAKGLFTHPREKTKHFGLNPQGMNVILDCNGINRIAEPFRSFLEKVHPEKIIGFDHHIRTDKTIDGDIYIDPTSRSCSGVLLRFFQAIKDDNALQRRDLISLYCGMLSDYRQANYLQFRGLGDNVRVIRDTESLAKDPLSMELLDTLESKLPPNLRQKVYNHVDIISSLGPEEENFWKGLFSKVKTSPNGKLAYVAIDPQDEQWASLGMYNRRTNPILADFRKRILTRLEREKRFTPQQKAMLNNVEGVITFYRVSDNPQSGYNLSINTKGDYAQRLFDYVKTNINPTVNAGGKKDRGGADIPSINPNDTQKFINYFITAAQALE